MFILERTKGNSVVVERDDLEVLKSVLSHDLIESQGLRQETVEEMSIAALARQYTDDGQPVRR